MRRFWFHKEDEVQPEGVIKAIEKEPRDRAFEKARSKQPQASYPRGSKLPRGIGWGMAGLAAFFVVGLIVSFYLVRRAVMASVTKDVGTLQSGVADLQNFDTVSAAQKFASLKDAAPADLGTLFNAFGFLFASGRGAFGSFVELANQLTLFSNELHDLSSSSLTFIDGGDGAVFINNLNSLRNTVGSINDASAKLADLAGMVGNTSLIGDPGTYLPLLAELRGAKTFLDAFIPWLQAPTPHHMLILFQNPSEIRPAGGFLGSYADVTIANGSIANIDINDIADVDATFNEKLIPPKPLQLTVTKWRPADANWFFDFPTSASKTIQFFEASRLYSKTSTTFNGAIAISPQVVSDLLAMTGPVSVGKPATAFTSTNFLTQIQSIVQAGQATSATYPKQVLRDLATAIFAKLAPANPTTTSLTTSTQGGALLSKILDWISQKEVMLYFKNPALENFAAAYGAAGDVYQLPERFNGDYFSLVDANVGGGKSDLYVSSTVSYVGVIGADGTLTAHVVVTRKHNGNKSQYWWYQATSQDYVQLFTAHGSSLQNASGGIMKKITPRIDYAKSGYAADPLVAAIEATQQTLFAYPGVAWHEESGKQVFTTWSIANVGTKTQVALDYTHRLFAPPADGAAYEFVFEKQAGTNRHYTIEVDAPLGYIFAENNIASFMYDANDLPGRFTVNLTLKKI